MRLRRREYAWTRLVRAVAAFVVTGLALSAQAALDPVLSDEFDSPVADLLAPNASGWQILHPERVSSADISTTLSGAMVIVPVDDVPQAGWFQDQFGPLIYKEVTGNFAVVTRARVVDSADPSSPPTGGFNAGGFVIRDPVGTHSNDERWVMYNFGAQGPGGYARELKKTIDNSSLFLTPQFSLEEQLLVCRIGDEFRFYAWNETDSQWEEEHFYNQYALPQTETNPNGVMFSELSTLAPNGTALVDSSEVDLPVAVGERTPMRFDMTGIAATVQVGLMGHTYTPQGANGNTRAEFDFIRFAAVPPANFAACQSAIPLADPLPLSRTVGLPLMVSFVLVGLLVSAAVRSRS